MVKRFSGPKAYPIIGNLNLFFGSIEDITNTLIKVSTNYPSPQRFWIGSQLTIMVNDPKHMRILLKSSYSYEKNQTYDFIKSELGDGLLTAPDSFLSCDLDLQNNPECKLDEYISETMDIIMKRTYLFWLHPDIIFYNSYLGKKLKELVSHIDKITSEGSTTTAETLAFLFLMVATFPEVQQQIYEELYQMYGSSDPEDILITLEDIKEMKYLEQVIRETLRLFPPAAFNGRKISEDIEVDENVTIPKNSSVLFSIFTYFRMEKYWKQPLTFNPDRFLQNNYNPKYFFPFSTGKRDCIGQTFAMNEMKTIVATVLRKFIVQIDNPISIENIPIKVGLTLKPAAPILLKFNKR
ncbi:cytochrome P450 4g15-like [Polistes fuscatus]|uniref:cytochrome P450 4g15-like n=1 Tax=Polistes fuscatus TaxID=30207 RepID=UPI001CA9B860|nr:cytochrome P450 4g15-like [Polistes fuscatus]